MLHIISPAKSLDFDSEVKIKEFTVPHNLEKSSKLIAKLKSQSKKKLQALMSISDDLANLNQDRYLNWNGSQELKKNTKQAIFAFNGDVYQGLEANTLKEDDIKYAQDNLRILSGLYGVLKPLDLIEAHRLEMGTKLKVGRKDNLYEYWKEEVTSILNKNLEGRDKAVIVNLASNEYFKVLDKKKLKGEVITPEFRDWKNGEYKMISFFAKKARGLMSRYIIENKVEDTEGLIGFNEQGYIFNSELSSNKKPVFTREENR